MKENARCLLCRIRGGHFYAPAQHVGGRIVYVCECCGHTHTQPQRGYKLY